MAKKAIYQFIKDNSQLEVDQIKKKAKRAGYDSAVINRGIYYHKKRGLFEECVSAKNCVKKKSGISEDDMMKKFDNAYKLDVAVKNLPDGEFFTDIQMRQLADISLNKWKTVSNNEEYDCYKLRPCGNQMYWGSKNSVKRMRERLL